MKKTFLPLLTLLLCCSVSVLFIAESVYAQSTITLSFSPASQSLNVNDTIDVQVILNTGGQATSGVDADISFDNARLNLIDIIPGTIYEQYIGESINNATGRATVSGIASSAASTYSGTGTFATFRFRAIDTGTAAVSFDFTPGNSNDANVAVLNAPGDSLDSVQNASFTIGGSSTTTTTTTTTSGSSGSSSSTGGSNQMPVSGNSVPAIIIAIVGGFFVWVGSIFGKEA